MASPKVIIQILITGTQILGKAFLAAARQAAKNAKQSPQAVGGDVEGVGNATSRSITDTLTRSHRMTVDEAHLILNVKRGDELETIMKQYEHLFKANSPPPPPQAPPNGGKRPVPSAYSHYLQSKVVRAHERIEAELKIAAEDAVPPPSAPPSPPPPGANSNTGATP